jgi:two-component system CheB/CheR fusion protein
LRGDPATERLFLVAVTGYGQAEDRRQSQDAGFNLHLVKPVRLNDIQRVLAELDVSLPTVDAKASLNGRNSAVATVDN